MYNSKDKSNSSEESKKKNEVNELAQATFDSFKPFINIFDSGLKVLDRYIHVITKDDWRLHARYKNGEKPTYPDGSKFNPYLDIVRNIYNPKFVQEQIDCEEIRAYTSGNRGLGLLYIDLDAHKLWQTDQKDSLEILQTIFPEAFYRGSSRGENGYLKVRYNSVEAFNEVADQLQDVMGRWFLQNQILCDFEIKGTITTKHNSGKLAKLPFTNLAKLTASSQGWGFDELDRFNACPIVPLWRVKEVVDRLEADLDPDLVAKGWEQKNRFIQRDNANDQLTKKLRGFGWTGTDEYILREFNKIKSEQSRGDGKIRIPVYNNVVEDVDASQPSLSPKQPRFAPKAEVASTDRDGFAEGDAFARNFDDLLPFTRQFYKQHKRFPSLEDALVHLRDSGLFSGCWDDNESRRQCRVGQILSYIEDSFDPALLGNDDARPVVLKSGKFSWWVSKKFGRGINMEAKTRLVRTFDPVSLTAPVTVTKAFVPARFIETFTTVANFCLNDDPLENKAVPTNRFKKIWNMVVDGAVWNQTYFQIVRDMFDRMGIIKIYDRNHETGKAWRWVSGSSFPAGSWKEEQTKLKKLWKRFSSGKTFSEFIAGINKDRNNKLLNTLYQTVSQNSDHLGAAMVNGPRPDI
ncbi:hypothetical protein Poly24_27270 [Rosistilla carotiformis]|uniref:Uncharacterized protein n=1 Tax=Rosistilla carotiformis TaxID=2528017 RepID=A0A518JTZ2_9BACT|nr:hypothetical protein [Rosistilla carotiformis]QDV69013.1 hypothetical protein Poly24_27270 [Rosistilla carotiformis]